MRRKRTHFKRLGSLAWTHASLIYELLPSSDPIRAPPDSLVLDREEDRLEVFSSLRKTSPVPEYAINAFLASSSTGGRGSVFSRRLSSMTSPGRGAVFLPGLLLDPAIQRKRPKLGAGAGFLGGFGAAGPEGPIPGSSTSTIGEGTGALGDFLVLFSRPRNLSVLLGPLGRPPPFFGPPPGGGIPN